MAAGDRAAFCDFYDRCAPLVYRLILRLVRDPGEAADVLQEVFCEAWQTVKTRTRQGLERLREIMGGRAG